MSTPTDIERISYGGETGSLQLGAHRQAIQGVGATRTLLAKESGALCLYDRAAGNVYTLPTAVEGMEFTFMTSVTVTTNAAKVICASGGFLLGSIFGYTSDVTEIDGFTADGTADVAISSNGSTTGGVIGGRYTLTAISATQWMITGNVFCGTATPATPIATS